MHIKDNLINFLYDQKYYIAIYDNKLYCFNYQKLLLLKDNSIKLKMPDWILSISGNNLFVIKMNKQEIMIKGTISNIGIIYE